MELGSWNSETNNLKKIRPLTANEIDRNREALAIYSEAQSRIKLFRILDLNYKAWEDRLRLEKIPGVAKEDGHLVLDQLMLNFLNTVYAISEHFQLSFVSRFRKNKQKLLEFDAFHQRLYDKSWPVAFCSDYRNYVQHCFLPIGTYNRNETRHGVHIEVTLNATELCRVYKDWKKSKLTPERGNIDLIDILFDCYHSVRKNYGTFVVNTFYPELMEVDVFFSTLTQEVKCIDSKARMVFIHELSENEVGKKEFTYTFDLPPNDVFQELGISFVKKPVKVAQ